MTIDFNVFVPGDPFSPDELASRMATGGWAIGLLPPQDEAAADVVGWPAAAGEAPAIAQAVASGQVLEEHHDLIGVCELEASPAEIGQDELEALSGRVRSALEQARTWYRISAPIGSPAGYTPDLQDALLDAVAGLRGAVVEIDGEYGLRRPTEALAEDLALVADDEDEDADDEGLGDEG